MKHLQLCLAHKGLLVKKYIVWILETASHFSRKQEYNQKRQDSVLMKERNAYEKKVHDIISTRMAAVKNERW